MVAITLSFADHHAGKTYAFIRAVISAVCPSCLRPLQEDLVQKAMVRVTCAFRKDEARTLNRTYLRHVARTVIVDEVRRQRLRKRVVPDTDSVEAACGDDRVDPERQARHRELVDAVEALLTHHVSPRRAEAVRLHLEGRRNLEIAGLMGIPAKSAENLTYRGMRDLREGLAAQGVSLLS